jgi:branched-chain amino acid transport system ATP-binding protein
MSGPMLNVEGLRAGYGGVQVIDEIAFAMAAGEVVGLMGRNGAGKSTTIKAVMGLIGRQGRIAFEGRDLTRLQPYQIARLGIGYVPEERRIFTDLTVRENLDVARRGGGQGAWDEGRVFALFPQLGAMADRQASAMSGGEQQMLTIARTLMGNPRLILLDEPSEGVAPLVIEQIAAAIGEMKRTGVAILLSEQNMHFAAMVADRALVLEQGRLVWHGAMARFMAEPELQRQTLGL